jgi:hypothetical protein
LSPIESASRQFKAGRNISSSSTAIVFTHCENKKADHRRPGHRISLNEPGPPNTVRAAQFLSWVEASASASPPHFGAKARPLSLH